MNYYFSKYSETDFETTVSRITKMLNDEGFGILTEIDVGETLKNKLDVDFRNYRILGACNPSFAYKALQAEDKIATMLPCNVVVQETEGGRIEVAAVDPIASMQAVDNPRLQDVVGQIRERLRHIIDTL